MIFRLSLLLFVLLFLNLFPQSLAGKKICLDPGHGMPYGATCDAETKRFEAYINHITVPYLKKYLQQAGATVITTRPDYDSLGPCVSLTERKSIANNAGATWFHSVHHNAFTGTSNYTLTLFKQISRQSCPTGGAAFPGQADVMSGIITGRIFNAFYTTSQITAGDSCFLGYNLGVLSTTAMPGTLSEGSFWDFPEERLRLANLAYLKTEAEALFHSFLQYYNQPLPAHGSLVGLIRNALNSQPAKNVTVRLPSLGLSTVTDNLGNGFFRFDSLAPGTYQMKVEAAYDTTTLSVVVTGGRINKTSANVRIYNFPEDIKLRSVLASSSSLIINWERPVTAVDSLYIYLSTDGKNFDENPTRRISGNLTGTSISGLTTGKQYYIRLKGKNAVGISTQYSKSYGAFTSAVNQKILVVDAFDNVAGRAHTHTSVYGSALSTAGIRFESVSASAVSSVAQLIPYSGVIWFTGSDSFPDSTFTGIQQAALKDYLNQGGQLFVSGSDFARDLGTLTGFDSKQFLNQYLKVNYKNPNPTPLQFIINGSPGSPASGYSNVFFGAGWVLPYTNVIDTINGSSRLFLFSENQPAGTFFSGDFPSSTFPGKVLSCSFPLESVNDTAIAASITRMAVSFFGLISNIENTKSEQEGSVINAYPNPGTLKELSLQFHGSDRESGNLQIFNVLGELQLNVLLGEKTRTVHLSDYIAHLPRAPYFVVYTTEGKQYILKIIITG